MLYHCYYKLSHQQDPSEIDNQLIVSIEDCGHHDAASIQLQAATD